MNSISFQAVWQHLPFDGDGLRLRGQQLRQLPPQPIQLCNALQR